MTRNQPQSPPALSLYEPSSPLSFSLGLDSDSDDNGNDTEANRFAPKEGASLLTTETVGANKSSKLAEDACHFLATYEPEYGARSKKRLCANDDKDSDGNNDIFQREATEKAVTPTHRQSPLRDVTMQRKKLRSSVDFPQSQPAWDLTRPWCAESAIDWHPPVDENLFDRTFHRHTQTTSAISEVESTREDSRLFGVGLFEDEFITEEDLARAAEKLGEDACIAPERMASDLLARLLHASDPMEDSALLEAKYAAHSLNVYEDTLLCLAVGQGRLQVTTEKIVWSGEVVPSGSGLAEDTIVREGVHAPQATLAFFFTRLSDVRTKHLENEPPVLMITVDHSLFLQFAFSRGLPKLADMCAATIKSAIQITNRRRKPSAAVTPDEATEEVDEAHRSTYDTGNDLLMHFSTASDQETRVAESTATRNAIVKDLELRLFACADLRHDVVEAQKCRDAALAAAHLTYFDTLRRLSGALARNVQELGTSKMLDTGESTAALVECKLCYAEKDTHVIEPCGHRLCGTCALRLCETSRQCPWDRVIYDEIRLQRKGLCKALVELKDPVSQEARQSEMQ
ncbi:hypothetical protein THASP1DRAFT_27777 [Thamnocephalis sphaerospora]|uniref:RING-type domain-containing protein n=1 Tax=Thamnocephalis sphaerospora TaxID=78915 RepID=A0A4P9XYF3_9FUNG|nr:hypothetical protein THASP1DRAFT_27777 [Thamnocephalis sphaerospora]|eukprot:RKP10450.1 hypothetical protein THASP1DRAFT_27777 [Thamnocephalis sphaerospora]